jgi:hypothetical protein
MKSIQRRIAMKCFSRFFFYAAVLILMTSWVAEHGAVAGDAKPSLKGAWKIERNEIINGSEKQTFVPTAFFLFFTEHYYSSIRDFTPVSSSASKSAPSSGKETGGLPSGFNADSGTYEFNGSTLTVHHTVSMMGPGASMTFGCELKGDTLILSPQFDKLVMPGTAKTPSAKSEPAGAIAKMPGGSTQVHYVFKRLE